MNPIKDSDQTRGELSAESGEPPIRLAGATLGKHRHICAFFHSLDEGYKVLLPFIREGFERGDKAFHVVNPRLRDEHIRRLQSSSINVAGAEKSGQLELYTWEDTYFPGGRFDQDKMLDLLRETFEGGKQRGRPLTRFISQMDWALEGRPGVDDLLEYETRFNHISSHYKDPVICVYDLAKFGADVVIDVMRTHPMIILGGILQENPFFVPPDEFLQELRGRRGVHKGRPRQLPDGGGADGKYSR